ncbi:MAG TPA: energy transducer TonB [Opitutales bacterium]|nr:energy transducer TonB [Opitutales bacterium]
MPQAPKYVNVSKPSIKTSVEAEYPLQSRRQHQHGTVTLGLYINELGSLDKVEIIKSSGYPLLDASAVDAIRQYRFNPAYQGTTPMRAYAEITLDFQLQ